jgi:hypothetical protein
MCKTTADDDFGYLDLETRVLEPLEKPFGPKMLPMQPVWSVNHVSGLDPRWMDPGRPGETPNHQFRHPGWK